MQKKHHPATRWCSRLAAGRAGGSGELRAPGGSGADCTRPALGEHRRELLSYQRAIELELLAISRMEKQVIDELREAADWTTIAFLPCLSCMLYDREEESHL